MNHDYPYAEVQTLGGEQSKTSDSGDEVKHLLEFSLRVQRSDV